MSSLNRYFQHPPRYQILHCLRNQVIGGTSIFVDALHAAGVLRHTHPEDFAVLTQTSVSYHYVNDGHHLHHSHPTIQLAPPQTDSAPTPRARSLTSTTPRLYRRRYRSPRLLRSILLSSASICWRTLPRASSTYSAKATPSCESRTTTGE